jgi:hypothetical protein
MNIFVHACIERKILKNLKELTINFLLKITPKT